MPRIDDHPLRLARVRAGMGQIALARAAGINRSTISSIEENRTVSPAPETFDAIETVLNIPAGSLATALAQWHRTRKLQGPNLSRAAQILLESRPTVIATFGSFVEWRKKISPSPTSFASLLGVNRQVIVGYERGIRVNGMPDPLTHALMTVLGVNADYLKVLQQLPPSED